MTLMRRFMSWKARCSSNHANNQATNARQTHEARQVSLPGFFLPASAISAEAIFVRLTWAMWY